jgi:hypothetical protein
MSRLVYSLLFETERAPGAEIIDFVVPLTPVGTCPGLEPIGKPRIVDLRPGDSFLHVGMQKEYKLTALRAYRQHTISEEKLASVWKPTEGYLV